MDISLLLNMTIWIFRFLSKAQNDNSSVDFSLVSLAQNDSSMDFHCDYALQAAWLRFYKRLKRIKPLDCKCSVNFTRV